MRGMELKHIGVRSFRLKGLTARWGIDGDRPPMPPALRTALVAWYNTRIQKATNFDVIESYAENFTKWSNEPAKYTGTQTPNSLALTNVSQKTALIYSPKKPYDFSVLIRGLQEGQHIKFGFDYGETLLEADKDGVYTLEWKEGLRAYGIYTNFVGACNITITQLPTSKLTDLSGNGRHLHLYGYTGTPANGINDDGWLQSAGVGYGISYGQPKLTDYTLCTTRSHAIGDTGALASKSLAASQGAFIFEVNCSEHHRGTVVSMGTGTHVTYAPTGFVYQTKDSYNGTPITAGTAGDADTLMVGMIRPGDPRMYKGSYKSFVLFNRTLTTEELAYVERWMA